MPVSDTTVGGSKRAVVAPVWSVLIPTYRPTPLLRDTILSVEAALRQIDAPAQLEVIDDSSPDVDVATLLQSWGMGHVAVYRRPSNGGLGACWNTCIERARGLLVHIVHQDDLVKPSFYARLQATAFACPDAGMIFCRTEFLEDGGVRLDRLEQDHDGALVDWLPKISAGQRLQCPSVVFRRTLYERIGGFDVDLRYVPDWVMWVKAAAAGDVAYVHDALAVYRIHSEAETKKIKAAGITTIDLARGVSRIREILSDAGRPDCFGGAVAYAIQASGFAVYEAESTRQPRLAAREVATSLRHLGAFMGLSQILVLLKSYVRLRLKALAAH